MIKWKITIKHLTLTKTRVFDVKNVFIKKKKLSQYDITYARYFETEFKYSPITTYVLYHVVITFMAFIILCFTDMYKICIYYYSYRLVLLFLPTSKNYLTKKTIRN